MASAATRSRTSWARLWTRRRPAHGRPRRLRGGRDTRVWYPPRRRGVRVVDGAALEKRSAQAAWVRIPPSPPVLPDPETAGCSTGRLCRPGERSPSGLWRRTGNAVRGNPSRVRIPPSPPSTPGPRTPMPALPVCGLRSRTVGCARSGPRRLPWAERPAPGLTNGGGPPGDRRSGSRYTAPCRARRGTSGALYLQSAPAGLNSLPRSPLSNAAAMSDVEGRVPRSGEPRTVSGPEGSSTKRSSSGAAERPGPSRPWWWARDTQVDGGCTALRIRCSARAGRP